MKNAVLWEPYGITSQKTALFILIFMLLIRTIILTNLLNLRIVYKSEFHLLLVTFKKYYWRPLLYILQDLSSSLSHPYNTAYSDISCPFRLPNETILSFPLPYNFLQYLWNEKQKRRSCYPVPRRFSINLSNLAHTGASSDSIVRWRRPTVNPHV
jgi:hypothetical protein